MHKYHVDIHLHTEVKKILTKESDDNICFYGVECTDHKKLTADACIICTGGCSYAATGSTGDGYRFAEETGHKVTERRPALVPLEIRESWCKELMGLSLKMWRSGCNVGRRPGTKASERCCLPILASAGR